MTGLAIERWQWWINTGDTSAGYPTNGIGGRTTTAGSGAAQAGKRVILHSVTRTDTGTVSGFLTITNGAGVAYTNLIFGGGTTVDVAGVATAVGAPTHYPDLNIELNNGLGAISSNSGHAWLICYSVRS